MKENMLVKTTEFAMKILSEYLGPGDTAVDGTMGNGRDTLALARLVGVEEGRGRVYAFDVQQKAVDNTGELLRRHRCNYYVVQDSQRNIEKLVPDDEGAVFLFLESHARLGQHVRQPVRGAIFNLGYLPGEDRAVVTQPETTLAALSALEQLLLPDGMIVLVIYSGHAGGQEEKQAVLRHMEALPASDYHASLVTAVNQPPDAPCVALITRKR